MDAKAKRQPNFYPPERVRAEINGEEPDSPEAMLIAAMRKAVDAADQAAPIHRSRWRRARLTRSAMVW